MKVVVFAHTPPPHHGQSQMVELMLRGLADPRRDIEVLHVNARFSIDVKDNAKFRIGKLLLVPKYVAQAIWLRLTSGARTFYYIPAPPVRNALFRDWLILLCCRPFFAKTIFHWHACGLGEWVNAQSHWIKRISHWALDRATLSIALTKFNEADASKFFPQTAAIVPNGIPDPCPDFHDIQRLRKQRRANSADARQSLRVVFLANLIGQKGFVDAINGVSIANQIAGKENLPFSFELDLAGAFGDDADRRAFEEARAHSANPNVIRHIGFVSGEEKKKLLASADIFCFPSYYHAENLPLSIIEAMAFGLPIVATRWRSLPEFFPADYPGVVDPKSPEQIAAALIQLARRDDSGEFRKQFVEHYTLDRHIENLARAFHSVEV